MSSHPEMKDIANFAMRDDPTPAFIEDLRKRFPTERETDELLARKMARRSGPPFKRASLEEMSRWLDRMLAEVIKGDFQVSDQAWFTGGVSKIQMGFTLRWNDPKQGARTERLVIRMDPSEASNTTSRLREYELIEAMTGVVPVPRVFWLDRDAKWFPEPALIYSFVPGVTKPKTTATGRVTGLGTNFGPEPAQDSRATISAPSGGDSCVRRDRQDPDQHRSSVRRNHRECVVATQSWATHLGRRSRRRFPTDGRRVQLA